MIATSSYRIQLVFDARPTVGPTPGRVRRSLQGRTDRVEVHEYVDRTEVVCWVDALTWAEAFSRACGWMSRPVGDALLSIKIERF